MLNRLNKVICGAIILAAATGASGYAGTVTFNFNALGENASAATINSVLTSQLQAAGCLGCKVAVTGAYADTTWNGDGHVTGPGTGARSLTLGTAANSIGAGNNTLANGSMNNSVLTTSGTYNTFLATTSDAGVNCGAECEISLVFTGLTLNSITGFNYEIFPDGTGQTPDLTLSTGSGLGTPISGFGSGGTSLGVTPGTPTNGAGTNNATQSPCPNGSPCAVGTETSLQRIGAWTTSLNAGGASQLNFIDWPNTIGFDNLQFSYSTPGTPSVPEPGSVVLLATVAAGLFVMKRKLRKA
jgi:hypothetical protein